MNSVTTKEQFALGSKALNLAFDSQAGSIEKALSELISNGFDADSPEIHVTVTTKGFSVKDTGRGFTSTNEINEHFSKVAFDHSGALHSGNTKIGRHGLGRLQIMMFATASWRTHTFNMAVDIKNSEKLGFVLSSELEFQEGCTVSGEWYKPLNFNEIADITTQLTKLFSYVEGDVYINGSKINSSVDQEPTIETDEFIFYHMPRNKFAIYNRGIFVSEPYNSDIEGIFISKLSLKLNTARTSILKNECLVWRKAEKLILRYLDKYNISLAAKKARHPIELIDRIMNALRSNRVHSSALYDSYIIRCSNGSNITPRMLVESQLPIISVYYVRTINSEIKEKHKKTHLCIDFTAKCYDDSNMSMENVVLKVMSELNIDFPFSSYHDPAELLKRDNLVSKEFKELEIDTLTQNQNIGYSAINELMNDISYSFHNKLKVIVPAVNLDDVTHHGTNNIAASENCIYIEKSSLNFQTFNSFYKTISEIVMLTITNALTLNKHTSLAIEFNKKTQEEVLLYMIENSDLLGSELENHYLKMLNQYEGIKKLSATHTKEKQIIESNRLARAELH